MPLPSSEPAARARARAALADVLSAGGLLTLGLDLFTSSSYKVTAFGIGLCIVGGFLRLGRGRSQ